MEFKKASFGGTASKSGGGKLEAVTKGGLPPSGLPGKSSIGRMKGGIATPTKEGDKGVPPGTPGKGSGKAPRD